MGQSVEVIVSELDSAAARLDDAAQRLRDGLSGVDDDTTRLLGSGWKGGAASAYAPAWEKWHDGAKQVVEGLQRMSELLTIAGKEYAKTDESASGALGATVSGGTEPQSSASSAPVGRTAMQPLTQAGKTAAGTSQQIGQAVAGFVQQAAQLATAVVEQAEAAASPGDQSAGPAPLESPPADRDEPTRSVEQQRSREV